MNQAHSPKAHRPLTVAFADGFRICQYVPRKVAADTIRTFRHEAGWTATRKPDGTILLVNQGSGLTWYLDR